MGVGVCGEPLQCVTAYRWGLHPASSVRKFLFMDKHFIFYADESGHADDPTLYYAGMAGFVAPAGAWEIFEDEWNQLLKFAQISELHMKHFVHSEGEFSKWKNKETERIAFLGRALEIIRNTHATPIGAVVSLMDFETLTETQKKIILKSVLHRIPNLYTGRGH